MRFFLLLTLAILACTTLEASAQPNRPHFTVPTADGWVRVEAVGTCAISPCPAVIILSGSRGFDRPAYDDMGYAFAGVGISTFLVNVLSPADLTAIADAGGVQARLDYYASRLPSWTSAVQGVAAYLEAQPGNSGKVGVLGISLGAQIASAAVNGHPEFDALVLVDGGFPTGYTQPIRSLPPLKLIWGSADTTFPVSIGHALHEKVKALGIPVSLEVFDGGAHDFFLGSGTNQAIQGHQHAAAFLATHLVR